MQFVCDLKLPHNFQPVNSDGEVGEFYCWSIEKVCCLNIIADLTVEIIPYNYNLFGMSIT